MTAVYGRTIQWRDGSISVHGCPTAQLADLKAIRMARACGWVPPRWWEFWRWSEPRQPADIVAMTEDELDTAIAAEDPTP